jgi:hypothetical protein
MSKHVHIWVFENLYRHHTYDGLVVEVFFPPPPQYSKKNVKGIEGKINNKWGNLDFYNGNLL